MNERLLLQPAEIVDYARPLIFLAGPIQGASPWQYEAAELIHELNSELIVAYTRKEYKEGEFIYEKQVDWETHNLNRAAKTGAILFWLASQIEDTPSRAYAQTTRFELGEWKVKYEFVGTKLAMGIGQHFGNYRYLKRRLAQDCPNLPIYDTLEDTCAEAVRLIDKK
jgi:hypothetical protein